MKLIPFLTTQASSSQPWQWPSCGNIKTNSFRVVSSQPDDIFKMTNSTFAIDPPDIYFTTTTSSHSSSCTFSNEQEQDPFSETDPVETVIRDFRSERFFFEPGPSQTSSILEEAKTNKIKINDDDVLCYPYKESEIISMESNDPYGDFRRSMEEMVEANGLNKDWTGLEELLSWYLRVNQKTNHGYIVGAFIDLLVGLSIAEFVVEGETGESLSSSPSSSSFTISHSSSPLSFPSSLSIPTPSSSSQPLNPEDHHHQNVLLS